MRFDEVGNSPPVSRSDSMVLWSTLYRGPQRVNWRGGSVPQKQGEGILTQAVGIAKARGHRRACRGRIFRPLDGSRGLRVRCEQFSRAGVAAQFMKFGPERAAHDQRRAQNLVVTRRRDVPGSASMCLDERVQMGNRQQWQIAGRKQNRVEVAAVLDRLRPGPNRLRLALLRVLDFGARPLKAVQLCLERRAVGRGGDDHKIYVRRENGLHRAPDLFMIPLLPGAEIIFPVNIGNQLRLCRALFRA